MFNQLMQRKEIPASPPRCGFARPATPTRPRSSGWPQLDSSQVPRGDVLLAEVGEELWAALSLDDGHAIADPLRPSADAVLILAQRSSPAAPRRAPPVARPVAPALCLTIRRARTLA